MESGPNPETYNIGYAKPPKQAQFKKGQSGNSQGSRHQSIAGC